MGYITIIADDLTGASDTGIQFRKLGGKYRIPHGISNAILLPYVMEYNADYVEDKFRHVSVAMGMEILESSNISKRVVDEIYKMTDDLKIPHNLKNYGITNNDLDILVENAFAMTRLLNNNPKPMTKEDIRNIYRVLV